MFILEADSWSFLSIFETESNLSDAYKKVYAVFVIRLFRGRKKSYWENRLSLWDNFICCHFLINKFHYQIKKSFYSKRAKIYSYWTLFELQRISVSLRFLRLCQVNFYSKQVNSCLFWGFFSLIMRIRNL